MQAIFVTYRRLVVDSNRRMWGAAPRPALAAVRLGGQSWRASPLSCPHSSGSGRSCRVKGSASPSPTPGSSLRSDCGLWSALDPPSAKSTAKPNKTAQGAFSVKHIGIPPNPCRTPSRPVSGSCGGIGGVAPDGGGCFAAIKPAPGMNAGYVLRKPLTAFASWKTGFCCARCCAVGVVGQGAGVLGGLSAPSGGLTRGRGSRREAVGEPLRGSPAFRPLAAVSFPQRLSQGDVKEFIKLKTARARYGV